jgi:hypothetical protein
MFRTYTPAVQCKAYYTGQPLSLPGKDEHCGTYKSIQPSVITGRQHAWYCYRALQKMHWKFRTGVHEQTGVSDPRQTNMQNSREHLLIGAMPLSAQHLQKRLCIPQVGGIEALREPVVNRDKEVVGFTRLALALPGSTGLHRPHSTPACASTSVSTRRMNASNASRESKRATW